MPRLKIHAKAKVRHPRAEPLAVTDAIDKLAEQKPPVGKPLPSNEGVTNRPVPIFHLSITQYNDGFVSADLQKAGFSVHTSLAMQEDITKQLGTLFKSMPLLFPVLHQVLGAANQQEQQAAASKPGPKPGRKGKRKGERGRKAEGKPHKPVY